MTPDRPGSAGHEPLEHTADEGIRAWGADWNALLAAAARGLFSVIADLDGVRPEREREVVVEADSRAALLHDWLEQLNALHQIERELYGDFEVEAEPTRLRARVRGEPIDPQRHALRTEVKAVTWHDLVVEEVGGVFRARVLFDV